MNTFLRRLRVESLESRLLLAADCFQNPVNPNDVNGDHVFSIADTRAIFAGLNSDEVAEGEHVQMFNDVNGDGSYSVSDLRSILNATYMHVQQDIHSAIDNAMSAVSEALSMSDLLSALDHIPNLQIPSEVHSALENAYNNAHEAFDHISSQIWSNLSHAASVVDDALSDLDMAIHYGLENSASILSSIQDQISHVQSQVHQDIQDAIDHALHGSNGNGNGSSGPLGQFLDKLGVVEDFIHEVESGQVTLSSDGQYVYDLVADAVHDPALIGSLLTADQDRLRYGVIDILDAYEDSGRELPELGVYVRSELIAGEAWHKIYIGLIANY